MIPVTNFNDFVISSNFYLEDILIYPLNTKLPYKFKTIIPGSVFKNKKFSIITEFLNKKDICSNININNENLDYIETDIEAIIKLKVDSLTQFPVLQIKLKVHDYVLLSNAVFLYQKEGFLLNEQYKLYKKILINELLNPIDELLNPIDQLGATIKEGLPKRLELINETLKKQRKFFDETLKNKNKNMTKLLELDFITNVLTCTELDPYFLDFIREGVMRHLDNSLSDILSHAYSYSYINDPMKDCFIDYAKKIYKLKDKILNDIKITVENTSLGIFEIKDRLVHLKGEEVFDKINKDLISDILLIREELILNLQSKKIDITSKQIKKLKSIITSDPVSYYKGINYPVNSLSVFNLYFSEKEKKIKNPNHIFLMFIDEYPLDSII